ncbi:fumarylacetoacetate hydrolase domain-containing protein 1 [Capsaspora owczarzaki ATCC 30864]|uniref:Fumarylacetoacetate hydrolase domain-containing protein 1 n=1 Tax=Capsaspora owczarzaki (strain ATCC 30864) TaxID=595528 RepID=A0A0D2X162_CAPO3|nr:fumarylacetoacetate hydrolase domain-containing protein 1 [Capsaspora owczarzaki ATCC 30864]KJE90254.1 fumarylacetoacetate hydrolase domain-containing protein 1 [Capsaspora owczarzaki ATCC 30864]|eukprot:XP_004364459.1 fumarylacetoacetate hydrolase domain-containing protein 1 [Capsaspora owczarzaki ATCC 30864]
MSRFVELGRKIVAIGRNYREHAAELNNPVPKEPLFFLKPTTSYLPTGKTILIPDGVELDHEVELAVVIGKTGANITKDAAMEHVAGYALALDMTARNLQAVAKAKGLPWTIAKGQDGFCPISALIEKESINLANTRIWLKVDGEIKQDGNTRDMIFNVPTIISYVSQFMTLEENDVILTGTPAGVGQVKPGQVIECGLGSAMTMSFPVGSRAAPKL